MQRHRVKKPTPAPKTFGAQTDKMGMQSRTGILPVETLCLCAFITLCLSSYLWPCFGFSESEVSSEPVQGAAEAAPRVSGIYSPKRSVFLQAGRHNRLLRTPEVMPLIPFTLFSQVNDLVEVTFADGSVIRQGPNTLIEYVPSLHQVSVVGGSVLGRFSKDPVLKINSPEVQGRDAVFMVTVSNEGIKVFSLSGKVEFRGKRIEEGQMYYYSGRPQMEGPFLIDLGELMLSSPLTIEFPASRWVKASTEKSIGRQKRMKDLGLVEPTQTMLEGSGVGVKRALVPDAGGKKSE